MDRLVPPTLGERLVELLLAAGAVLVLSGLGCATERPPAPLPAWVAAGAEDPAHPGAPALGARPPAPSNAGKAILAKVSPPSGGTLPSLVVSTSLPPDADGSDPDGPPADAPRGAASLTSSTSPLPKPLLPGSGKGRNEGADFVVAALQGTGLRFGTDGSARALWGYMKEAHEPVAPREARRGDVLFFNVRGPADLLRGHEGLAEGCADHVALVWNREPDGRIVFIEVREHRKRFGYVFPAQPGQRRARDGRVLNTFLRAKKPLDPREARYLAGEMLCGVARPRL